jgi:hypothetical protein
MFLIGSGNDPIRRGFDQRQDFGKLGLESMVSDRPEVIGQR